MPLAIMSHIETLKEACSTIPEASPNLLNMFDILQIAFIQGAFQNKRDTAQIETTGALF